MSLWNKLQDSVVNSKSLHIFKQNINSSITSPAPPPSWFSVGKRKPNLLHARLRLSNSSLNKDRFRLHLTDSPSCHCGADIESHKHYILQCTSYSLLRNNLLKEIRDVVAPGASHFLLPQLSEDHFMELVIRGSTDLSIADNTRISLALQYYLVESGRF